ncbi:MAG: hypothetical protein OES32_00800 [Acidobacteriota bacterium]|nr:hypothetical protein [Acidobacteriota bacterium]
MAVSNATTTFNPFPGLRPFEPGEDHLFFGRESEVDELLARLDRSRFLTVVGASGSGKSSLVRSGLIPYLYSGYLAAAGSSWRIAILRPGDDPLGNLAASLGDPEVLPADGTPHATRSAIIEATLRRGGQGLTEAVRQSGLPEDENLLILVDQFEEIFRFKRSAARLASTDESTAFMTLLLEASRQQQRPIFVVLTMRSDFLGNCTEFQDLPGAINRGLYLIPRMTREERRSAITGPVAVGGAEIAERLVLRLLNDGGDDPDELPILQHSLMRTWDYWERNHIDDEPLDLRHYEAIGTTREALSLHAEEALVELGTEGAIDGAEKLFKCITEKGIDGRGIRRPSSVAEICAVTGLSESEVRRVVEVFRSPGRSFLIPPVGKELRSDSVVDISHESLMRVWTRLRRLVDQEAQGAQVYLRLAAAAARYQDGQGGLLRDPELQLALSWRESAQPTEAWAQRYDPSYERAATFLELSRAEREREMAREDQRRRRKLRGLRMVALGSALAVGVILVLFGWALVAKGQADEALGRAEVAVAREARAKEEALASEEEALRSKRRAEEDRARALSAQAAERLAREKAVASEQTALRAQSRAEEERARALEAQALEARARREAARNEQLALKSQGEAEQAARQARAAEAKTQRLRRLELARRLAVSVPRLAAEEGPELAALIAVEAYRLNRSSEGEPRNAEIYDALLGAVSKLDPTRGRLPGHDDQVRALAVAADGSILVSGDDSGQIHVLDPSAPAMKPLSLAPGAGVRSLALDAEGGRLAVGDVEGRVRILALGASPAETEVFFEPGAIVSALAFSSSGTLAAGLSSGRVRVWSEAADPASGSDLEISGRVTAVDFAPDASLLAAAGGEGLVRVWQAADGAFRRRYELSLATVVGGRGGGDPGLTDVRSLAFHPAGDVVAVGNLRGDVFLWQLGSNAAPRRLVGHRSSVNSLRFARDGELLASAGSDGTVRIWSGPLYESDPLVLSGHDSWVWAVAFHPDVRRLFSGGADGAVRSWATGSEELVAAICSRLSRSLTSAQWARFFPEDLPYEATCP